MPPPSQSPIYLISAWFESPPAFSSDSSRIRPPLLAAPYSGAVVSLVESDCVGGREVNWKKLRCSYRRAEARKNKLDISPIHVARRVYTIYPPQLFPPPTVLPPAPQCTHNPSLWPPVACLEPFQFSYEQCFQSINHILSQLQGLCLRIFTTFSWTFLQRNKRPTPIKLVFLTSLCGFF